MSDIRGRLRLEDPLVLHFSSTCAALSHLIDCISTSGVSWILDYTAGDYGQDKPLLSTRYWSHPSFYNTSRVSSRKPHGADDMEYMQSDPFYGAVPAQSAGSVTGAGGVDLESLNGNVAGPMVKVDGMLPLSD